MPHGPRVVQRLWRGRQRGGPLGEQRPQRCRPAALSPRPRDVRAALPHGVHDRAEGERLAERRAHRDQRPAAGLGAGAHVSQRLADQPALADPGLALDQHDARRPAQGAGSRASSVSRPTKRGVPRREAVPRRSPLIADVHLASLPSASRAP